MSELESLNDFVYWGDIMGHMRWNLTRQKSHLETSICMLVHNKKNEEEKEGMKEGRLDIRY